MYIELENGIDPIIDNKKFYDGDTSVIYKDNDLLYKIYLKNEPHKQDVIDYLIKIRNNISDVASMPIDKVKLGNYYGLTMKYIDSYGFYKYFLHDNDSDEYLRKMKILSDNLKLINKNNIYFTDLHHNNIVIDKKTNNPIYIDLDDARVNGYEAHHICYLVWNLHNIKERGKSYEKELLEKSYLDRESLVLLTLNYLIKGEIEKLSYDDYQRKISEFENYFNKDTIDVFRELKQPLSDSTIPLYTHYIGDYIDEEFKDGYSKVRKKVLK